MSMFQILVIALGALIAASAFWGNIVNVFKSIKNILPQSKPSTQQSKECSEICDPNASDLVKNVALWEHLKEHCEEQDLKDASNGLDKVFPLLVKSVSNKPEVK